MIGIYIRVSTIEQVKEGYSISAQRERLTAFCKAQGWSNYKFYVDEGISGRSTNRPELEKLINDVQQDKIRMILVYKLDRFTRSVLDLHKMLEVLDKHGCTFKSATEPYDTSTAMGRMFITIVAAMAQWEVENSSERIKMALEEKVSKGERVGNVPYGFDLNEEEKLVANEKANIVLDMIDKLKSGWSAMRIADYLTNTNDDKGKWLANTVLRILRNPALYGSTRWNDRIYENTHEGLISKEEYLKIQQILEDRTHTRLRNVKNTYVFQNKIVCPECGKIMSVNRFIRKRADGSNYEGAVYRCQPCAKSKKFTKSPSDQVLRKALYEYMENVTFEQFKLPEQKENPHIEELKKVEKKREKFQRAWANDLMTDGEFKKLMNETKEIYDDLKAKTQENNQEYIINPEEIKDIVISFNDGFKYLDDEHKREFISRFIRKIEIEIIETPPKRKDRSLRGQYKTVISNIVFM
ncbi:hypothetical protein BME96_08840 [Virgibacillus halodenitrificans]|uniref:Recombinase family protein n=1 Tax=Virgibacillus halodenitrificans TaxID=1482 RepID=A0AAC9J0F3_VIRHA|nr:recombinase family protein [Virgibacillus halodenitrificans]APC48267.1 hypothetical protein BME96_08840 [Virgibacillus halodenitrificans]